MLCIKNAAISAGEKNKTRQADIYVEDGKIKSVVPAQAGTSGTNEMPDQVRHDSIVDATGLLAIPGAIDPHVHFDTPGFEHREDFAHGTRAAAAGGVTTVIDMPCTSIPPVTSLINLENKLRVIETQAHVDFALWGGVSQNVMRGDLAFERAPASREATGNGSRLRSNDNDWFTNMDELWQAGVIGFKTYMISGMDSFRAPSFMELGQIMQYARKIGALVGIHAENGKLIYERMQELKKAPSPCPSPSRGEGEGGGDIYQYYLSRAEPAEKDGVALAIGLANQTKVKLHIVHLGSGVGAHLIEEWKGMGLDISTETCPHYLTFTHSDFKKYGSLIKTAPVVKEKKDRECLWKCLESGTIDFIATDHAPCQLAEKHTGSAWTDYGGLPGVELLLPFIFSEGFKEKRITLARLIEVTSTASAKRFGLYPQKGSLNVGSDADIVLIDPKKKWKVDATKMHSKAKWTPFHEKQFTGKVIKTILRGEIIFDAEKDVTGKAGYGKWVKRDR